MEDSVLGHKKRRHDPHYQSGDGYHPRYKKHMGGQREDWRQGPNFRDNENRYMDRQDRGRNGNQFRENNDTFWDVEINLIGQKDPNPMIHLCDTCRLPIRSYGRLIPCKHVFCFKCAKKTDKNCPRCGDEVHRIEQCRHGTVWMCSVSNCSRTYLSQRDLQAHVNHRHSKPPPPPTLPITVPPPQIPGAILVPPPPVSSIPQLASAGQVAPYVLMPNVSVTQPPPTMSMPTQGDAAAQGMDMMARPSSNLITIQIQDDQQSAPYVSQAPPAPAFSTAATPVSTHNNPPRTSAGGNQWPPQTRPGRTQNRSNY